MINRSHRLRQGDPIPIRANALSCDTVLEADPVASAVRALMATRDRWAGTASGLLGALAEHVDDATRRGKAWPATPRALSARLRRAATFLRKVGVTIDFLRQGHEKARLICIECKSAAAQMQGILRPHRPQPRE